MLRRGHDARPAVLLAEPSEGLAPVIVEQMAAAVSRMRAEGIAVVGLRDRLGHVRKADDHTRRVSCK